MKLFIYKVKGNEIHDSELKKYYSKIDEKKRKQIDSYKEDYDKSKCFISHLIIYLYYKGNVNYTYNPNGKIYVNNLNQYFNISYSFDYIVVVFNDSKVGIDIEKINQINEKELDYYASDDEKKFFANKFEYTKLWCLKESYLKYLGSGITNNLKHIEFYKTKEKCICKNNKELYINIFTIDKSYICSVIAERKSSLDIEFVDIDKIKYNLNNINKTMGLFS